jgi:hypothetical protein
MIDKDSPVGRSSDKFMLRLPDGMREQIAESAKQNNRSMNAEIVARIEDSYKPKPAAPRNYSATEKLTIENRALRQRLDKIAGLIEELVRPGDGTV